MSSQQKRFGTVNYAADQPGVFVPPTMLDLSSQAGRLRERVMAPETAFRTDRVVVPPPAFCQDLRFLERIKQLAVEKLFPHFPLERFDRAILPGGPWLDIERRHLKRVQPLSELVRDELRSIIRRICVGIPRLRNRSSRINSTSCERIRRATTEARYSRVYSSRILRVRKGRSSCVRSATKSYDQT